MINRIDKVRKEIIAKGFTLTRIMTSRQGKEQIVKELREKSVEPIPVGGFLPSVELFGLPVEVYDYMDDFSMAGTITV
jgi:hypothetical protein